MPKPPPSPPAWPLIGHIPGFYSDVLGMISHSVQQYGDVLRFRLGTRPIYLVNHPDDIQHVLRSHARNYDKKNRTNAFLRDVTGESLLTSNGEAWLQRRHLFQPSFHREAINGFQEIMHEEAENLTARWQPGTTVESSCDMMQVTFRVVARALFGAKVSSQTLAALEQPIDLLLAESLARHGRLFGYRKPCFTRALNDLNSVVARVLEVARPEGDLRDLLTLMRKAEFSDQEIRDESVTFLLAGHETTANALTWLLAFLSRDPKEQERCAHDPDALDRALRETLRLAPPIWIIERHAIDSDEISGYTIPSGSSVVICPYTVHRHKDFWQAPEKFLPDRFTEDPPAAYLPFGIGPRFCIGREFSLMEARIIAGAILKRFQISPVTQEPPVPQPSITLRIRGGLKLKLHPRT
jgi:enediyne biosynthesis protein E7